MEHRSLSVAALLSVALLAAAPATADQQADWDARMAKAKALQADGKQRKEAAAAARETEDLECQKRFRVYACQGDAQKRYVKAVKEARRLENEGGAMERQVKKEQLADKDQHRRDEAPQREADRQADKVATEAERATAQAHREERLQGKEAKAEEGARRQAKDAERQAKKRADHERKVAEKLEKARRREAEDAKAPD